MRALIREWESSFAGSWSLFALAALPGSLSAAWGLIRLSPQLTSLDFAEWAFLTVATTVVGSISQLGLKPGYMQYATDHGSDARYPGLRAAMLLVAATGGLGGLALAGLFSLSTHVGLWKNTTLLPWLVPLMALGNITMMLYTDLRILGRSSVIALLAFFQLPVFILALEVSLALSDNSLAALYSANVVVSLIFALTIAFYGGVFQQTSVDFPFVKWAVGIGLPAMAALLSKYSADLTVAASFRWLAPPHEAGLYGLAAKLTEPLMSLYIGSFQMAWGAFVYGWIKSDPSANTVAKRARWTWWYAAGSLPVGLCLAAFVWAKSETPYGLFETLPFLLMCMSRAAAFGISSPMGFGQTILRDYRAGFRIHMIEFLATVTLVPIGLIFWGVYPALGLAATIPWVTVLLLRDYSQKIQSKALSIDSNLTPITK